MRRERDRMSDTTQTRASTGAQYSRVVQPEPTGWVGWVFFAGIMMVMLGAFQAMAGFVALFQEDYYLVPRSGLVVTLEVDARHADPAVARLLLRRKTERLLPLL